MARTIDEIQAEIIASVQNDPTLSQLNSTSATALWRLCTRVIAVAIAVLENIYDLFRAEVQHQIDTMKPHSLRWYREKALGYMHGYDLAEGVDEYDVSGLDQATIDDAKIVAAAAAEQNGVLILKVNKLSGSELVPLDSNQYDGFVAYLAEIKDAGVDVQVLSFSADKMQIELDVYYDPLVLSSTGARLDGSASEPLKDGIRTFLKDLPFNGKFVKAHLVDALQGVEGVFVPSIVSCEITRFDSNIFTQVDVVYDPYSGFIRVYDDADFTINYIPNV